jgi:hypothetical protein
MSEPGGLFLFQVVVSGSHRVLGSGDAAALLPDVFLSPDSKYVANTAKQAIAGLWADSVRGNPQHGPVPG